MIVLVLADALQCGYGDACCWEERPARPAESVGAGVCRQLLRVASPTVGCDHLVDYKVSLGTRRKLEQNRTEENRNIRVQV